MEINVDASIWINEGRLMADVWIGDGDSVTLDNASLFEILVDDIDSYVYGSHSAESARIRKDDKKYLRKCLKDLRKQLDEAEKYLNNYKDAK